jgi:L-ascorbate 6-phosphate lactonase
MTSLAQTIQSEVVEPDCLSIFWLCQAGFVFKANRGQIVYVDPYLSDVVERVYGFKRMMACPITAGEVVADLIVCTHEHEDHMDTDALPVVARESRTHFAGPIECVKQFKKMSIPPERCHLLEAGKEIVLEGISVKAVYADHGELAPDALGVILDFDGIKVYHTGDTAYRPEKFKPAVEARPDVLLPCINGRFGNLNAEEAALLARDTQPRVAIASHFWMFVEHNGDPGAFLEKCSQLAPGVQARVMKPGEKYLFRKL